MRPFARKFFSFAVILCLSVAMIAVLPAASLGDESSVWVAQPSGTTRHLHGVSAAGPDHVWAVGDLGTILFFDGTGWSHQDSGTTRGLRRVSAAGPDRVWAVGDEGTILFYDGTGWVRQESGTTYSLRDVSAAARDRVWAVGDRGTLLRYDGTGWSPDGPSFSPDTQLIGVSAPSRRCVWVAGRDRDLPFVYYYDGSGWSDRSYRTDPAFPDSVSALDGSNVWVTGSDRIRFYDGTDWSHERLRASMDVCAVDENHVWSVGHTGSVGFYNGSYWYETLTADRSNLDSVSAADTENVWAVGEFGTILFRSRVRITACSPASAARGQTLDVLIGGEGTQFREGVSGATLSGGGIRVNSTSVFGRELAVANVTVAPDADPGPRDLNVVTGRQVPVPLAGGLRVKEPRPRITSVTPDAGVNDGVVSITNLAGSDFARGAAVRLKMAGESDIVGTAVNVVSPGRITCRFDLDGAKVGAWDVFVRNPDGQNHTLREGFEVKSSEEARPLPMPPPPPEVPDEYERVWYFPEGTTREGFEQWLCLGNPTDEAAGVQVLFMYADSFHNTKYYTLEPKSRTTIDVNLTVGEGKDVSMRVSSNQPIAAERPMYFSYKEMWDGGHNAVGAPGLDNQWYFAEGTTREGFEQYLCVQNPGDTAANLTVTYMFAPGQGPDQTSTYQVNPFSRLTVDVNEEVPPERDVSVRVASDRPVAAERPMYFNYRDKWAGGHTAMGTNSAESRWYFAEGTTRNNSSDGMFEEWLSVQNPGNTPATLEAHYMYGEGQGPDETMEHVVDPESRLTLDLNLLCGPDRDVSVRLDSDVPVIAERPMYFLYHNDWQGGHNVVGVNSPAAEWYFAEGTTRPGFEEWLTIQNPGDEKAAVDVTFLFTDGPPLKESYTVEPRSRFTLSVNGTVGPDRDVSMEVRSDADVICERPMYFNYRDKWQGGHCVLGAGGE
jgi:hypothetical protein